MSLKGSTAEFPLDVLIRLLRDQKKTGELTLRSPSGEGALGLNEGRVIVAVYGDEQPVPALGAIFEMTAAEFEFTPWTEAPAANLDGDLDELLRKAREHREWLASVRQIIPNDRVRFRLSERAAEQGAVTFTPDRWRVVLAVNGTRDVNDIAAHLHIDRDAALNVLSGLVRDGVIDTIEPTTDVSFGAPEPQGQGPLLSERSERGTAPPEPEYVAPPAPEPEPEPEYVPPPEPEPEPPVAAMPAPEPAPAAQDWGTPAPAQEVAPPMPEPAATEWAAPAPEPAAPLQEFTPPPPAQDWGAPPPAEEIAPPPMRETEPAPAPAMDDRLAALFGAPAPAETPPAPAPADQWSAPAPSDWTTPAPAADQWTTPNAPEAPAPDLTADPRLGALTMPPAAAEPAAPPPAATSPYPFGSTTAPANEWAAPAAVEAPPPKKKGLFGRFGGAKEEAATAMPTAAAPARASSRVGQLAAFSNALLTEYNSGQYGKQRIDDRMPSLLMRVDEQADPIDRPLPVLDDRLDVEALDRVSLPEAQAAPYLAMLVTTIYGDAEKAFGKDKAKKGYKVAQQQVFAGDTSSLGGPDLAGKLPKV